MATLQTATGPAASRKSITVIKVGGYLDFTTSDEIDRVIDRCVRGSNHKIIVDLAEVDYISSRGWSIFLSRLKEIRDNGGDLKLARMKPDVFQVYEVLEFFWFLKSYESLEEAISEFEKGVPPMPE
ncbi:MAG TPA: STAS domain-containing protein [bacterium]